MAHTQRNLKIALGVMAALLALSIAGGIYYWDKSQDMAQEKNSIEQQANTLLLAQSHGIDTLNKQLQAARDENKSLAGRIAELNHSLNQKYAEFWETDKQRAARQNTLRYQMRSQLSQTQSQAHQLTNQYESLADQNTQLRTEIAQLEEKLQAMRNVLTGDRFRMRAVKRNEKETAKAKKVHTLTVSLQVPPMPELAGTTEAYLSLTDLHGNIIGTPLHTATIALSGKEQTIPVHAIRKVDFSGDVRHITFTIESTEDLQPGTYQASVYTPTAYLGAMEFHFRDSFWFL